METFTDWLEHELKKRDWRLSNLAKKAGIDTGSVSRILNGTRQPGPEVCRAIARAFNYSPEIVFRQARLLPPAPEPDLEVEEAIRLFEQLAADDRKRILQTLRAWTEHDQDL